MINYNVQNKQAVRQLLDNLFSELPNREKDVLIRRNQLLQELLKKETLKEIGDEYNITRERVRQIENEGIKKLHKAIEGEGDLLKLISDDVSVYFDRNGGAVLEDHLLETFIEQLDLQNYNGKAVLFVLDQLVDTVERKTENVDFHNHWVKTDCDTDHIMELVGSLVSHLDEKKKSYSSEDLMNYLISHDLVKSKMSHYDSFLQIHDDLELSNILQNYLNLSKKVNKNILDQWGLSNWPEIRPKKLSDKIFLVFQNHNKPFHFTDVAVQINEAGFDKKKICAATVHNELIANKEYTLVGRGIYALKDWGYEKGTVADVIEKILKASGPMEKNAIYEQVLKQRVVNKSTIYLSLINKEKFIKIENGKFGLKA